MSDSGERTALRQLLKSIHDAMAAASRDVQREFAPGGRVPTSRGGTGGSGGAEPPLGNPDVDGKALVSTAAGVRSWAAKQAENALLTALAALSSTGLVARTGSGTVATRTLTAGSGKIAVTNGNGVSGNPTVDLGTLTGGDIPNNAADTTGKAAQADALNSATTAVNVAAATAPSTGQVLTATDGTHATWQTPGTGLTNPMTTKGDLIVGAGDGSTDRALAIQCGELLMRSLLKPAAPAQAAAPTERQIEIEGLSE